MIGGSSIRHVVRSFGLGRHLLKARRMFNHGPYEEIRATYFRTRFLHMVQQFEPLPCVKDGLTCYMLLHQPRAYEGLWAFYTLRRFLGPCRLVLLDDGSLSRQVLEEFASIFPGIEIPNYKENNAAQMEYLLSKKLNKCTQWREKFILFRKLIDPILLSKDSSYLLIDSDILHFSRPKEVLDWIKKPFKVKYASDTLPYSLCAEASAIHKLSSHAIPQYFNSGLPMRASRSDFS